MFDNRNEIFTCCFWSQYFFLKYILVLVLNNILVIGFEIDGLEKIPDKGAALIVYYHGTLPIDFYYLAARCLLEKKRHIRAVGDNFLFHIPGQCLQVFKILLFFKSITVEFVILFFPNHILTGLRRFLEVFRVTPGTLQSCVSVLNDGHLLAIAPGILV